MPTAAKDLTVASACLVVEELQHDSALDGLKDDLEKDLESNSKGHALLSDTMKKKGFF